MAEALTELFKRLPETARITSGVRTYAKQAQLYADFKAGRGGLAAPPGRSRHEFGRAVDIGMGVDMETLREAVKQTEKLEQLKGKNYERDKVHVQLRGTRHALEKEAADMAVEAAEKACQRGREARRGGQARPGSHTKSMSRRSARRSTSSSKKTASTSTPTKTLDQKTLLIEANRIATELNNEAEQNGITVTTELAAAHQALAMSMAQSKLAADGIATSASRQR